MGFRNNRAAWLAGVAGLGLLAAGEARAQGAAAAPKPGPAADSVSEVIVTANKRPERLSHISASVTAFTASELTSIGASDYSGYLTRTPGVVLNQSVPGYSTVIIRGVATTTALDQGQGTTGFYIDDIPLTDPSYSIGMPDIDTFDVDNVAVLRGPQSTLYGAAALGGTINYQTAQPNLHRLGFAFEGDVQDTAHGGAGGAGKVMLNVPVVPDVFAVRGVYVYRDDAGYIDNIGTHTKDSNETITQGGRIEATWKPVAGTEVNYLFLKQRQATADAGYQEPLFAGELEKRTRVPDRNVLDTTLNSLRLDQDTPLGTVTASATYHQKTMDETLDYSFSAISRLFGGLVSPIVVGVPGNSDGTTFEARLASPSGRMFEYLVGVYHDDTRYRLGQPISGPGSAAVIEQVYSGVYGAGIGERVAPNDTFINLRDHDRSTDTAVFGEATLHLGPMWKITAGGRYFQDELDVNSVSSGIQTLLQTGHPTSSVAASEKSHDFLPKASITFTPDQNLLFYGLMSKGFRVGGPNLTPSTPTFTIPGAYSPDSLYNYEVGVRSTALGGRLHLSGTLFYIDWSNIQLRFISPNGFAYATNAGKATNYGFEGAADYSPLAGLNLQANLTWLSATLNDPFNPGGGAAVVPKGATLPGASKWQVSSLVSYQWRELPLTPRIMVAQRYISKAPGPFNNGVSQGGFNTFDIRGSIDVRGWELTLYCTNFTDQRGVSTAALSAGEVDEYLIRPRTVGLQLDYRL